MVPEGAYVISDQNAEPSVECPQLVVKTSLSLIRSEKTGIIRRISSLLSDTSLAAPSVDK